MKYAINKRGIHWLVKYMFSGENPNDLLKLRNIIILSFNISHKYG